MTKGLKALGVLLAAMSVLLVVAILAYAEVIDLPGEWRTTLGFQEETPNPPCRLGLYRRSPAKPAPPPGHWRFEPETPRPQVEGSAAAIGPVIYTAGGSHPGNLHTVLAFDTRSRHWTRPPHLPFGINHTAMAVHDGKLYLAGGFLEGESETDRFLEYDPATGRWSELPPMATARGGAAAAVIGDRMYVVDGGPQPYGVSDPRGPYKMLEIFDFETGEWSSGPPPPVAVHHVSAAVIDGKLYMAGGRVDHETSSDAFVSYDPATEEWTRLANLPEGAVSSLGTVAAGGQVVVFGGDDEVDWEDGGGWVSASAWAYDPETRRWTRLPDLGVERHAFGAAVAGGRIYAIGGSICPGLKPNGPVGTHTVESLPISALRRG